MLSKGIFFEKSADLAVPFIEKAAAKDLVEAVFLLASHLYNGDGIKKDRDRALKLFEMAAEKGLAVAQHNLAAMYFQGDQGEDPAPVKKQIWKAIEYWDMAASQGFPLSLMNLGKLYLEGYTGGQGLDIPIRSDHVRAREYFERVASVENPLAEEARELLKKLEAVESKKEPSRCSIM